MKNWFLLFTVLLLSACGSKLEGTYADGSGSMRYSFNSNGKVSQSLGGMEYEMDYKVEGNKIKIMSGDNAMVMNLLEDGSIQGPMGIKLTKQK